MPLYTNNGLKPKGHTPDSGLKQRGHTPSGLYINVKVVKAVNLPLTYGAGDSFVKLTLQHQSKTSNVVESSFSPVWNEIFCFDVEDTRDTLVFQVFDKQVDKVEELCRFMTQFWDLAPRTANALTLKAIPVHKAGNTSPIATELCVLIEPVGFGSTLIADLKRNQALGREAITAESTDSFLSLDVFHMKEQFTVLRRHYLGDIKKYVKVVQSCALESETQLAVLEEMTDKLRVVLVLHEELRRNRLYDYHCTVMSVSSQNVTVKKHAAQKALSLAIEEMPIVEEWGRLWLEHWQKDTHTKQKTGFCTIGLQDAERRSRRDIEFEEESMGFTLESSLSGLRASSVAVVEIEGEETAARTRIEEDEDAIMDSLVDSMEEIGSFLEFYWEEYQAVSGGEDYVWRQLIVQESQERLVTQAVLGHQEIKSEEMEAWQWSEGIFQQELFMIWECFQRKETETLAWEEVTDAHNAFTIGRVQLAEVEERLLIKRENISDYDGIDFLYVASLEAVRESNARAGIENEWAYEIREAHNAFTIGRVQHVEAEERFLIENENIITSLEAIHESNGRAWIINDWADEMSALQHAWRLSLCHEQQQEQRMAMEAAQDSQHSDICRMWILQMALDEESEARVLLETEWHTELLEYEEACHISLCLLEQHVCFEQQHEQRILLEAAQDSQYSDIYIMWFIQMALDKESEARVLLETEWHTEMLEFEEGYSISLFFERQRACFEQQDKQRMVLEDLESSSMRDLQSIRDLDVVCVKESLSRDHQICNETDELLGYWILHTAFMLDNCQQVEEESRQIVVVDEIQATQELLCERDMEKLCIEENMARDLCIHSWLMEAVEVAGQEREARVALLLKEEHEQRSNIILEEENSFTCQVSASHMIGLLFIEAISLFDQLQDLHRSCLHSLALCSQNEMYQNQTGKLWLTAVGGTDLPKDGLPMDERLQILSQLQTTLLHGEVSARHEIMENGCDIYELLMGEQREEWAELAQDPAEKQQIQFFRVEESARAEIVLEEESSSNKFELRRNTMTSVGRLLKDPNGIALMDAQILRRSIRYEGDHVSNERIVMWILDEFEAGQLNERKQVDETFMKKWQTQCTNHISKRMEIMQQMSDEFVDIQKFEEAKGYQLLEFWHEMLLERSQIHFDQNNQVSRSRLEFKCLRDRLQIMSDEEEQIAILEPLRFDIILKIPGSEIHQRRPGFLPDLHNQSLTVDTNFTPKGATMQDSLSSPSRSASLARSRSGSARSRSSSGRSRANSGRSSAGSGKTPPSRGPGGSWDSSETTEAMQPPESPYLSTPSQKPEYQAKFMVTETPMSMPMSMEKRPTHLSPASKASKGGNGLFSSSGGGSNPLVHTKLDQMFRQMGPSSALANPLLQFVLGRDTPPSVAASRAGTPSLSRPDSPLVQLIFGRNPSIGGRPGSVCDTALTPKLRKNSTKVPPLEETATATAAENIVPAAKRQVPSYLSFSNGKRRRPMTLDDLICQDSSDIDNMSVRSQTHAYMPHLRKQDDHVLALKKRPSPLKKTPARHERKRQSPSKSKTPTSLASCEDQKEPSTPTLPNPNPKRALAFNGLSPSPTKLGRSGKLRHKNNVPAMISEVISADVAHLMHLPRVSNTYFQEVPSSHYRATQSLKLRSTH